MSADNFIAIRDTTDGKYVVMMGFASDSSDMSKPVDMTPVDAVVDAMGQTLGGGDCIISPADAALDAIECIKCGYNSSDETKLHPERGTASSCLFGVSDSHEWVPKSSCLEHEHVPYAPNGKVFDSHAEALDYALQRSEEEYTEYGMFDHSTHIDLRVQFDAVFDSAGTSGGPTNQDCVELYFDNDPVLNLDLAAFEGRKVRVTILSLED